MGLFFKNSLFYSFRLSKSVAFIPLTIIPLTKFSHSFDVKEQDAGAPPSSYTDTV
jgi:hypothetical protein